MKKGFFLTLFIITIFYSLITTCAEAIELTKVEFHQVGEVSQLELSFNRGDVKAKKFHVIEDKQLILDLQNVTTTERVIRAFDTSEFSGSVVFVTAYKKPNSKNDLRIAVQMRDNSRSVLETTGKKIILKIENRFGVFTQDEIEKSKSFEEKVAQEGAKGFLVPKSDSIEDILENLTLSGRKKYVGKRISFNIKNVSVDDVLKMIADASGFNIIITNEITKLPPLTLNLTNIPWDQALDTVLGLNKLVAKKNGMILIIDTLEKATQEKKREIELKRLTIKQEALVTKIFPISYAELASIAKILEEYLTKDRGKISQDKRTNVLIIKDTAAVIEKMRKILGALDTQTPQVLIESKIVEVSESYAKSIGLQNGLNFGYDPIGSLGSVGEGEANAAVVGSAATNTINSGPGFSFSSAPSSGTGARNLLGLSIGRVDRLLNLNFTLQLMESESKGKVIASPKVIAQHNQSASITSTETTSYATAQTQSESGEITSTSFEQMSAQLDLKVTPQVTNEGSIILKIDVKKESFGTRPSANSPPNVTSRQLSTKVLVDNGSTIVIGGIYSFSKQEAHSGIPFLKDIPIIGWLFRTAYAPQTDKSEMIIFLTPRIINQEEAGLVDNT